MATDARCTANKTRRHQEGSQAQRDCPACGGGAGKRDQSPSVASAKPNLGPTRGQRNARAVLANAVSEGAVLSSVERSLAELSEAEAEEVAVALLSTEGDWTSEFPDGVVEKTRSTLARVVRSREAMMRVIGDAYDDSVISGLALNPGLPNTVKAALLSSAVRLPRERRMSVVYGMLDASRQSSSVMPDFILERIMKVASESDGNGLHTVLSHRAFPAENLFRVAMSSGHGNLPFASAADRIEEMSDEQMVQLFEESSRRLSGEDATRIARSSHGRRLQPEELSRMAHAATSPEALESITEHRDVYGDAFESVIARYEMLSSQFTSTKRLSRAIDNKFEALLNEAFCDDGESLSPEAVRELRITPYIWSLDRDSPEVVIAKTIHGTVER